MKLINKSHFDSKSLRTIFLMSFKEVKRLRTEIDITKYNRWVNNSQIVVKNVRQGYYTHGEAYIGGVMMNLWLQKDEDVKGIAWIFIHEFFHNLGFEHNRMDDNHYKMMSKRVAEEFHKDGRYLKYKEEKKSEKVDIQLKRYNHVKQMVDNKRKQFDRLKNQLKKWTDKQKRYEKILLANGKLNKEKS